MKLKSVSKKKVSVTSLILPYRLIFFLILLIFFLPLISHASTYAYIPDYEASTISVIRTSDDVTIETIVVGKGPSGVAVSPSGEYVYVSNRLEGTVSIINTTKNIVTDTVIVGNDPIGIAVGLAGYFLYVANYSDNTVSIITTSGDEDNSLLTTVPVGSNPYGLAVDPDGEYVYVTNSGENTVTVFSFNNDPVTVKVGNGPLGITTDKRGEYVYVANELDNTISVISIEGENTDSSDDEEAEDDNQVIKTIAVGKRPYGVTFVNNANSVYVTNNLDDTLSVIDALSHTLIESLNVSPDPTGIANPLNGDFAYILHDGESYISVIDTTDNTVSTFSESDISTFNSIGNFIGGRAPETPLSIYGEDIGKTWIDLIWIDYSYNELGFILEKREYDSDEEYDYEVLAVLGSNINQYTDTELSPGKSYQYRVKAYNEAADSTYSIEYSVQAEEEMDNSLGCFINTVWNFNK